MTLKRTFPVVGGAEEIGVIIRTERGFEAHHHVLGYLATYQAIEAARSAVFCRDQSEDAA